MTMSHIDSSVMIVLSECLGIMQPDPVHMSLQYAMGLTPDMYGLQL